MVKNMATFEMNPKYKNKIYELYEKHDCIPWACIVGSEELEKTVVFSDEYLCQVEAIIAETILNEESTLD
jgi:hypothetical protein